MSCLGLLPRSSRHPRAQGRLFVYKTRARTSVQQRIGSIVASRVPFFDMASVKSLRPKVETQHQKIRAFLAGAAMPTEKKKTAIETLMSLQRPRRVPYSYNIYTRDICLKKSNNTHNGRCICALKAMKRKHPTLRVKKYM